MDRPLMFDSLEKVRKQSLISARRCTPLSEALIQAQAGIFEKLRSENTAGMNSTAVVSHRDPVGLDGQRPTQFKVIAPGQVVLGQPPLPEYCLVIETKSRHRHLAIVSQMDRLSETEVVPRGLRTLILLDRGFNATMADDPIWLDLLECVRRVHRSLNRVG